MVKTYQSAGVDIQKANSLIGSLKSTIAQTYNGNVVEGVGGFASLYEMQECYLASSTDGVGTKLLLGIESARLEGLGQDLVAMSANDLICTGAAPMFFLDYIACSELNEEQYTTVMKSIASACAEVGAALIGGETAEMPGLYQKGHFDLAGFCVGQVSKDRVLRGKVELGDTIYGVASSGPHSNGFSLLRKLIDVQETELVSQAMRPTTLYVKPVLELLKKTSGIHGIAHITGGGLSNIERINPDFKYVIDQFPASAELPAIFSELQKRSQLNDSEFRQVFNAGVGLAIIGTNGLLEIIREHFGIAWEIGSVQRRD